MALWTPRRFRYGSGVSGRENGVAVAYELERHENTIVNKEPSGALGTNGTIIGAEICQKRDPVHGPGLVFGTNDAVNFTVNGTTTAGAIAFTYRPRVTNSGVTRWISAALVGATYYRVYFSSIGNLTTRLGNVGNLAAGYTAITQKSVRVLASWSVDHVWIYVDGVLVHDYDTVMADNIGATALGLAGAGTSADGELYDYKFYTSTLTATEVANDYAQYARRCNFLEDLSGAFVSSADQTVTAIENTIWTPWATNGQAFRIVDAALPGKTHAKAIRCISDGTCYAPTQHLGLKAADPEGAYGTWSFYLNKADDSDTSIYFISDDVVGTNGYALYVSATERVYVREYTAGAPTARMRTVAGYITPGEPHLYTITRRFDGYTVVSVDGVPIPAASVDSGSNPFTNNDHKSSSYFVNAMQAGDELTEISKKFGIAA
jgi:hypothetical protein